MVERYTIGESIALFFDGAGQAEPPAELLELLTTLQAECPLV